MRTCTNAITEKKKKNIKVGLESTVKNTQKHKGHLQHPGRLDVNYNTVKKQ